MVVTDQYLISDMDDTALNTTYAYTAHVVVIVYRRDKYLKRSVFISARAVDVVLYSLKQRLKVHSLNIGAVTCCSGSTGAEKHWAVKLLVRCTEIHEELEYLVYHFSYTCIGTVDLVYDNDQHKPELESLRQDEPCLWHRAFRCIHKQENPICHFKDSLYFSTEVSMSRGVYDIYLYAFICAGTVLGKDGDASFSFDITAVHDPVLDHLIFSESTALA